MEYYEKLKKDFTHSGIRYFKIEDGVSEGLYWGRMTVHEKGEKDILFYMDSDAFPTKKEVKKALIASIKSKHTYDYAINKVKTNKEGLEKLLKAKGQLARGEEINI